jgi:hypothetical protein
MRQVLALLAAAAHAWVFDAGRKTDPATGGVLTPLPGQFAGLANLAGIRGTTYCPGAILRQPCSLSG